MKIVRLCLIGLLTAAATTSCSNATLHDEIQQEAILSVQFEQPDIRTRAATSTTALSAGVQFKVYAYNQATAITETTAPLAEGEYKVADNGTDIEALTGKSLKLYAGVYDFYFVSYNVKEVLPTVGTSPSSCIGNLTNGTDFLYVALKNVGVRSTESGKNTFTVKLEEPFTRLCSAMKISVKAKEGITHPVTPRLLAVKSIAVEGLSGSAGFVIGKEALNVTGTGSHTFAATDFNTGASATDACTSKKDYMILPTDGSSRLDFTVTLTITYDKPTESGTTSTTEDFPYKISLTKALLAGMRYEFAFTLTFYDHYLPGDLELDVLPFVEVPPLNTDIVGS